MALDLDKLFSVHVSMTLDCLGKSQDMVKYRVIMYKKRQKHESNLSAPRYKWIIAGSKGEGLTAFCESDFDNMHVPYYVLCADRPQDLIHMISDTMLLETERHDTPAGYTKLKFVKLVGNLTRADILLILFAAENGDGYLSSELFVADYANCHRRKSTGPNIRHHERSGPSIPVSFQNGGSHVDIVYAFSCICPDIVEAFISRPRIFNRPSRYILNNISNMEGHVVSVGFKESETSYQEWRICFTKAELHLVQSFNDIETKLYILLKMISKLMKHITNDITSYVMKNIALWLFESNPENMFVEGLLTTRLVQALVFLQKCVEANFLPSFMIPERNLLAGKLNHTQRYKITLFLSTLIHEGGCMLLRCEKLRAGMAILYREPDMAEEFRRRRDKIEMWQLFLFILHLQIEAETGLTDEQIRELGFRDMNYTLLALEFFNMVVPEIAMWTIQGYRPDSSIAMNRLVQWLS